MSVPVEGEASGLESVGVSGSLWESVGVCGSLWESVGVCEEPVKSL